MQLVADALRRRGLVQVLLLTAGFFVLVAISATSIVFVDRAREDSSLVVHTVEVENQIAAVLLELHRAESAGRGFLLTSEPRFLNQHDTALANILGYVRRLRELTLDNPVQTRNSDALKAAVETRLNEFRETIAFAERNDQQGGIAQLRAAASEDTVHRITEISNAMRREEDRLFAARTVSADRSQQWASMVTIAGSGLVVALAAFSIFLVRRSSRARDEAEAQLRDNNLNLEETVAERTADLREANEEVQRFAYIVSHDLRSPLVNIMGFTSELGELRGDIFRRISSLSHPNIPAPSNDAEPAEPLLESEDAKLSEDFNEALGFIKSSIGKMDRLISAILHLTREGRREFQPVSIDLRELIEGIVGTVAHQSAEANAEIRVQPLPVIVSDRLALEQIFSNLIDNALKYLRTGVAGDIAVSGRTKLGFAIIEVSDNGRGIDAKDHQRIFELFRRAGPQDRPGQGIGLAHVRALVRRLGGTLSVTSELDAGSTFTVTLPIKWALGRQGKAT
ncbi:MAG: CHASE3 domain-containing protein [Xanthobacteraceae bacterium]